MKRTLIALVVCATIIAVWLTHTESASAHPLGNFTINHSTTIEVSADGITLYRVLDLAEIPAFQTLQDIPKGAGGEPDLEAWAKEQSALLAEGMMLQINGDRIAPADVSREASLLPGQGGLQTLRLDVTYRGELPDGTLDGEAILSYSDDNYSDRIGWREVIVRGGPGVDLVDSNLPAESPTNGLRSYPETGLTSPPNVREASTAFEPGVGLPRLEPEGHAEIATRGNPDGALGGFTKLIAEKELSATFIAFALLAAVAFGAIHALSPGHGKTVVAAYLVGSRGTLWHAALLGFVVTATHTSSVYALGLITLYLSQYIVPEDLYPWMGVASGSIILVMGLALFVSRLRASGVLDRLLATMRPATTTLTSEHGGLRLAAASASNQDDRHHAHVHDTTHEHATPHEHGHAALSVAGYTNNPAVPHSHGFGSHTHEIPGANGEPVTWQRLVGLGIFGGMIPCPSAIVVMLSAIALHRVGFGLALIVAFSFGLAAVLTGIGFLVVWAQRVPLLRRVLDRTDRDAGFTAFIARGLPIGAAALVCVVGVVLVSRAAGQF